MVQSYIEPDAILYHGVKNGIDLWPWKLSHRLLNTDIWAYLRNSWVIAFICGVHRDYVSAKLQMTLWAQFDLCLTPRKASTQTKYAHMPYGTMWAQGPWAHFWLTWWAYGITHSSVVVVRRRRLQHPPPVQIKSCIRISNLIDPCQRGP